MAHYDNPNYYINTYLMTAFGPLQAANDRLKLKTLVLWPLQADPTTSAPYIVFGPHPQLGRMPIPHEATIGGPTAWHTTWRLVYGTALRPDRDSALADIEEFGTRIQSVIEADPNLGGLVSPQGNFVVCGNSSAEVVLGNASHGFGGDGQFYGQGKIVFRYRYERQRIW